MSREMKTCKIHETQHDMRLTEDQRKLKLPPSFPQRLLSSLLLSSLYSEEDEDDGGMKLPVALSNVCNLRETLPDFSLL